MVEVAKQDRDAALEWIYDRTLRQMVQDGKADTNPHVLAFAQHRIATEAQTVAEIVAWLREVVWKYAGMDPDTCVALADAIEQRAYK